MQNVYETFQNLANLRVLIVASAVKSLRNGFDSEALTRLQPIAAIGAILCQRTISTSLERHVGASFENLSADSSCFPMAAGCGV